MEWSIIEREGYGAQFNRLSVYNNLIKKEAVTSYGEKRMTYELNFLNFIKNSKISFPIPEIIETTHTSYIMKYYKNYSPLSKLWNSYTPHLRDSILNNIGSHLYSLHTSSKNLISKSEYEKLLVTELIDKTIERIQIIKPLLEKYKHVNKVNGVDMLPFDTIINFFIQEKNKFINSKNDFELCPIHGDCQFNNILIGPNMEIIFIDPRGYFGNSEIYGLREYDQAKVDFALSGYDTFDSMSIESLNIKNDTIFVDDLRLKELESNRFTSVLVLAIWLGNAHCFIENTSKAFYSYSYAMWLASMYINGQGIN